MHIKAFKVLVFALDLGAKLGDGALVNQLALLNQQNFIGNCFDIRNNMRRNYDAMRFRVMTLCFGSRPAVGSSKMRSFGLPKSV